MPRRLPTRPLNKFLIFISIAGLSLVLLEVLMGGYFYWRHGQWLWPQELYGRDRSYFQKDTVEDCAYHEYLHPHPYLTYVARGRGRCQSAGLQRFGLKGPSPMPYEKNQDDYVVLLTGGSVADIFSQYVSPQHGHWQDYLNRHFVPPDGKKQFRVVGGAFGDWRVPQPLILLQLHAHAIDAVVTIGGFNEYLGAVSEHMLGYPSPNFFLLNPQASGSMAQPAGVWLVVELYRSFMAQPLLRNSYTAYQALQVLRVWIRSQVDVALHSDGGGEVEAHFAFPAEWDSRRRFNYNVDLYKNYLRQMNQLAELYSIRTLHFLQPVPQFFKRLTSEEKRATISQVDMQKYPQMAKSLLPITNVVSLLELFSATRVTVYQDVVHYRSEEASDGQSINYGNELLLETASQHLAKRWALGRRLK